MWEALRAALRDTGVETPDEGFRTTAQWARAWNKSLTIAERLLRRAIGAGLVETKPYRIATGSVVRSVNHYRYIG